MFISDYSPDRAIHPKDPSTVASFLEDLQEKLQPLKKKEFEQFLKASATVKQTLLRNNINN